MFNNLRGFPSSRTLGCIILSCVFLFSAVSVLADRDDYDIYFPKDVPVSGGAGALDMGACNEILCDDFEGYATGTLSGQGDWTGNANPEVENSVYFSGSKAGAVLSKSFTGYTTIVGNGSASGTQTFYLRFSEVDKDNYTLFGQAGSSRFRFGMSSTHQWDLDGASSYFFETPKVNTWYKIFLEWTDASSSVRATIDDSTTTPWRDTSSAITAPIDTISIGADNGNHYWDLFGIETASTSGTTSSATSTASDLDWAEAYPFYFFMMICTFLATFYVTLKA